MLALLDYTFIKTLCSLRAGSQQGLLASGGDTTQEGSPVKDGGGAPQQDQEEAVPEKLADDDAPKLALWRRVLYWFFPKLRRGELDCYPVQCKVWDYCNSYNGYCTPAHVYKAYSL